MFMMRWYLRNRDGILSKQLYRLSCPPNQNTTAASTNAIAAEVNKGLVTKTRAYYC